MTNLNCDCNIIHNDLVYKAKKEFLEDSILNKMTAFYKSMGDKTRIKILYLLTKVELCVCDISNLLDMTKSAVSHQLKYLKEMKLIKSRKLGKEVWYSLSDNHVKKVFDMALEHVMEVKND